MQAPKMVRPDSKGRITLGHLADGISGFVIKIGKHNTIILEPYVELPQKEKWLFDNEAAAQSVKRGLKEVSEGKLRDLGSFSKHMKDK
jgi:hypothetical protein